jgi:copper chaperone CopZ
MKKMKKVLLASILLLFTNAINAQDITKAEIKIKSSATCSMCKTTIEKYLSFEKGIKKSSLDVDSKILTVIYNPQKTTPEKIRLAVSKSGYDADEVKANEKAYNNLDDCCKKGKLCTDK